MLQFLLVEVESRSELLQFVFAYDGNRFVIRSIHDFLHLFFIGIGHLNVSRLRHNCLWQIKADFFSFSTGLSTRELLDFRHTKKVHELLLVSMPAILIPSEWCHSQLLLQPESLFILKVVANGVSLGVPSSG